MMWSKGCRLCASRMFFGLKVRKMATQCESSNTKSVQTCSSFNLCGSNPATRKYQLHCLQAWRSRFFHISVENVPFTCFLNCSFDLVLVNTRSAHANLVLNPALAVISEDIIKALDILFCCNCWGK